MKIYYCPVCPIHRPGWLKYWKRNDHIKHEHPGYAYPKGLDGTPSGTGLKEWRELHEEDPWNPRALDADREKLPMLPPRRGRYQV